MAQKANPRPQAKANSPLITYSELEKKLHFDNTPVSAPAGAIASYAPALEKVMPCVVTVLSSKTIKASMKRNPQQEELFRRMFPDIPDDFFEKHRQQDGKEQGLGSGIVIDEDGYILTNNHVVRDADEILVTLSNEKKQYPAKVAGTDPRTDVALIKIEAKGLKAITIGDSSKLKVGDIAFAIGNPLGLKQTATQGIISALGRADLNIIGDGYENFIQTDASINKGNSGGALVDVNGRLIGMNTAIQSNFGGNIGIGFAIPSNMALNTIKRLLDGGGTVHRGFLGVYLKEPNADLAKALGRKDQSGVLIVEVGQDTPAEKSGLKAGDLIVAYNGRGVKSMPKLRLDISNTDPGTKVNFDIVRNGKQTKMNVILGDLENRGEEFASFKRPGENRAVPKPKELVDGVQISQIDEKVREALKLPEDLQGVLVKSVNDGTAAAEAGLRSGLVITQIDQRDVRSVEQAYELANKATGGVLLLQVYAAGRLDILAIELKK